MAAVKFLGWIQSFADHPCAARALVGYRRFAPAMCRGPVPWVSAAAMMGVAMVAKDEECAVMLAIQYMAYLRPSALCNLTVGQVIRLLQELGTSSRALQLARQEELEGFENSRIRRKRSFGRSSFGRTRPSIDEIHSWQDVSDTPLEPPSGKVRRGLCQMGRSRRSKCDHDSSVLGSSRRSVIGCALANQNNDGNSKTRQMAHREKRREVRKAHSIAQETSKLSDASRKCGQLVISPMSRLLGGALPPPPPVLTGLVRHHA